jgi:hypothetical protein
MGRVVRKLTFGKNFRREPLLATRMEFILEQIPLPLIRMKRT